MSVTSSVLPGHPCHCDDRLTSRAASPSAVKWLQVLLIYLLEFQHKNFSSTILNVWDFPQFNQDCQYLLILRYINVLQYCTPKQVVKSVVFCMDVLLESKRYHSGSSETSSTTFPVGVSLTFHNKNFRTEVKITHLPPYLYPNICHSSHVTVKFPWKFLINKPYKRNKISFPTVNWARNFLPHEFARRPYWYWYEEISSSQWYYFRK
jgi:hypothetical protein